MSSSNKDYVELFDGHRMPIMGFGTAMSDNDEMLNAMKKALADGYRMVDTAFMYHVEESVGVAIKNAITTGSVKREDVFLVTKLPTNGNRPQHVKYFLEKSLQRLQVDYIDLYLIHWPIGFQLVDEEVAHPADENLNALIDMDTDLVAIWKKLEEMVDLGLVKYIGLSNFNEEQISRILKNCRIQPANLQIECHAYFPQRQLVEFCHKNKITVTAYAPIGSLFFKSYLKKEVDVDITYPILLNDPALKPLAKKYNKSPAQILLRWLIERQIAVIPRSVNPERIASNFNVFDFQLKPEDTKVINDLDRNLRIFTMDYLHGIKNHPEFPFK